MTNFKVNAEERLSKIAEFKTKGFTMKDIAKELGIGYIGLCKWVERQEEKKNPKPKPKYNPSTYLTKHKVFTLTEREQTELATNNTLIFGDSGLPQYALMPYSKYASLVAEADKSKIQARLNINRREAI